MSMRSPKSVLAILLLALGVGVGTFGLAQLHREEPDALTLAPERTALIVEVNVAALKRRPWVARHASESRALQRLQEDCRGGLEGIEALRGYVLLDEREQLHDLVVSAHGMLDLEALTQCVAQANEGMGSALHETELEGVRALASDQGSSVAVPLGEHGVMTGPATAVASSLRQLGGAREAIPTVWRPLWTALRSRRDIRVVGTLPEGWRSFFGQRPRGDAHRPEHLALGVSLAQGLDAEASLIMPSPEDALGVQHDIEEQLTAWRERRDLMQSALRPALIGCETRTEDTRVMLSLRLSETETVDALLLLRTLLE